MSRIDNLIVLTVTLDDNDYEQLSQIDYVIVKTDNQTIMIRR